MIHSFNEWDNLKHVIVGRADWANWPTSDPVFARESEKTTWTETDVPSGSVPSWIIEEANQDLDQLAQTLQTLGVRVSRPESMNFQLCNGMYNYCPRDRLLIYGNTVVDPAMMYPCRDQEINCYASLLNQASKVISMPRDQSMIMDAANVLRLNDRMLFLESASGNYPAYVWLQEQFPDVEIEICNFYAGVHIDSTIVPLREGLVMLNASRVSPHNVPRCFANWDYIWVDDVVPQKFFQYPYASKWIAMNVLVINPKTVIVDRHQTALQKVLNQHGFETVPLELRHSRTLGGGFHCVTLDIERYYRSGLS